MHRDLRISVTDRCNFRCSYCMPAEGMQWLPRSEVLTFEEIERIARVLVTRFGIASIRLTGGEPTMRAHLPLLVAKLATLGVDLAMTTNGTTLAEHARELHAAGLRRVNVSLDTLRHDRFVELTRRDELDRVLAGITAAVQAGFDPVKVNAVVMAGVNEDEIVALARFARAVGATMRFIEFMPLDADGAWRRDQVVSQAEIIARLEEGLGPLEPLQRGHAPAERFAFVDGRGEVGVIPSVTRPFCEHCDRLRLTADGALRSCLFATDEVPVRDALRAGANDDELVELVTTCIAAKRAGHGISEVRFVRPARSMSQIGG